MDWFLYDNGLRHERVKCKLCLQNPIKFMKKNFFAAAWVKIFFVTRISGNKSIFFLVLLYLLIPVLSGFLVLLEISYSAFVALGQKIILCLTALILVFDIMRIVAIEIGDVR